MLDKPNNVTGWLKLETIGLIIQTLALICAGIWGYATLSSEVKNIHELLNDHAKGEANYVRTDMWQLRNDFIDKKLDGIERKLDLLLLQNTDYATDKLTKKK
jgi:hypothetical protein